MKLIVSLISVLVLGLTITVEATGTDADSPAQQYSAILREWNAVSAGMRTATTDQERKANVERLAAFAPQFLSLTANHPADPIALTALRQAIQVDLSADSAAQNAWEMNDSDFPAGSLDGSAERCVELLIRDHVLSEKLGPVVDRMRYGYRMDYDKGLSTVLEKNPHREVQGLACLALAQFLHDRLRMIRLVDDRPELMECCGIVFGRNYLPELRRLDRDKLAARIEVLFERAATEYADVKFRAGTVGEVATTELYDIRHLSVGRVAPDIVGKDQDGESFMLTDYRGKVVLLYFWSEY
ncbi:MAG: redoxin domain-containing protein [Planctomycetota bacterium]|nr:redoxin domain-containing protein [Planctomycetota bacterium]